MFHGDQTIRSCHQFWFVELTACARRVVKLRTILHAGHDFAYLLYYVHTCHDACMLYVVVRGYTAGMWPSAEQYIGRSTQCMQ